MHLIMLKGESAVAQLCPTLCEPVDCSHVSPALQVVSLLLNYWRSPADWVKRKRSRKWSGFKYQTQIPGFSVYGILQARILEWVAIPFSRGSYQPRD